MIRLVILVCLLLSSSASAEPGFGIAVNNPMMWRDQESLGGSLYYRFSRKQFIRLNVAYFQHAGSPAQHAIGFAREGYLDDDDGRYTGRSIDLGVGWMYFPRRAFDGPSLELGVLWREEERRHPEWSHTHNELARALVGWSVLWRDHMFASVAAGGSAGKANGHDFDTNASISRWTANFEGYVRVGLVFWKLNMRHIALLIVLASTPAIADDDTPRMALAVNSPLSWATGYAVAASAYPRLTEHQVLRLNFASYKYGPNAVAGTLGALAHSEGEGSYDGQTYDVGAGWMYFPRRAYIGPMFELGIMHRSANTHLRDDIMTPEIIDRDTQLYAVRALIGWSWLIHDRAMIAFAVGAASGYELGTETTTTELLPGYMIETHRVSEWKSTVEGYLRFGFTFGN